MVEFKYNLYELEFLTFCSKYNVNFFNLYLYQKHFYTLLTNIIEKENIWKKTLSLKLAYLQPVVLCYLYVHEFKKGKRNCFFFVVIQ